MAVTHGATLVAPSIDTKTKAELNDIALEAGLYVCKESVTIMDTTSSNWSVVAISNENALSLKCFTQIWIPQTNTTPEVMFMRTSNGTSYSPFTPIATEAYLKKNAILNGNSQQTKVVVSNTRPTPQAGMNIVWIDTSN